MSTPRVVIIGAGMAGLAAASRLRELGLASKIVDKGRGVGGRMATRRLRGADGAELRADHGAQFFTAREPAFLAAVSSWGDAGIARIWSHGFYHERSRLPAAEGHPRFCGTEGMASVCKHLAAGADLELDCRIEKIESRLDGWTVTDQHEASIRGEALLLTAPVPQALSLLDDSDIPVDVALRAQLETLTYHPCIAVMVVLDGPSRIPEPGAVLINREPVDWIADNRSKGICPAGHAITIHAGPGFSQRHFDGDREGAADELIESCREWLGANVVSRQVHGWRYASPVRCYPERSLALRAQPPLVLAGDAFGGPRVEGAYLSGGAAAEQIAAQLGVVL